MNKQDKKFFLSLFFAQTGILCSFIMFSPYYWNKQAEDWKRIKERFELSQLLKGQTDKIESETQVLKLKKNYERKGIGVQETSNLKGK